MENIYRRILNLPAHLRNPNYYQLLGVPEGSHNSDLIEACYKRQLQKVQRMGNNPKYKEAVLFIKGELRKARSVLTNPTQRAEYELVLLSERVEELAAKLRLFMLKGYLLPAEKRYLFSEGQRLHIPTPRIERLIKQYCPAGVRSSEESAPWLSCKNLVAFIRRRFQPDSTTSSATAGPPKSRNRMMGALALLFFILANIMLFLFLQTRAKYQALQLALASNPDKRHRPPNHSLANLPTRRYAAEQPSRVSSGAQVHSRRGRAGHKPTATGLPSNFPLKMVYVPAGWFYMGNDQGAEDERPQRRIYLDGYYISQYEITNRDYQKFVQASGHPVPWDSRYEAQPFNWSLQSKSYPQGMGRHPVVLVSWNDARDYCHWLSQRYHCHINLPTEAQWEKAARGQHAYIFPWGNVQPGAQGIYRANYWAGTDRAADGFALTAPVGSFARWASPYGCQDMAGNVYEWCRDWYSKYAYRDAPERNPTGPKGNWAWKVLRGGSWDDAQILIRSTYRFGANVDDRNVRWGIRVVIDLPATHNQGKAP